ncbi:kynureninase [Roseovarius sp. A21]|uniref:Kynureninase n=1 Tax=Roseovarius bejariae TaxID=2576383 RepID=A0A844CQ50_9RHOB|nr:kynureninase [Roseovarius bejariae]MRU16732.1 kynureninase [Roseovarius bejariae]
MPDFTATKSRFHLPQGVTYLDGNSLGPLPRAAADRMGRVMQDEWGEMLITGWNKAGWMAQPGVLGDRIGRLIGAEPGHVMLGDTLSIKVYQALAAALSLRPGRRVILSDTGNFPTDLYMAEGLIKMLGQGHELRCVAPEEVEDAITEEVAALMLTEVDYRTGRRHDMPHLTQKAHAVGALAIWDLAHSAGAVPVDVAGGKADFAVGCTYKFLNGGPGAPAFIYVAPRHAEATAPALSGWLGHAAPFEFEQTYRAAPGVARMRVGTPPVLAMASLEAALDIWDGVEMAQVYARAQTLSERFIQGIEATCPMLTLASPRDPDQRGSQVSFRFAHGYEAMQACIAHGVIGDFRAPDIMRFGITPLYLDEGDIDRAIEVVTKVMVQELWDDDTYRHRSAVT